MAYIYLKYRHDPAAPMGVPGAASLESETNYVLQNTRWASRCPLTCQCDTGTEAEIWIPTPISNKLLQDKLIQKQFFSPLAIKQWNTLPPSIASDDTLPLLFQDALSSHFF